MFLQHMVYTGTRSGSIQCFDKRLNSRQKGQELFNSKFRDDNRSVTHLSIVHGTQLLVSTIKGDVSTHLLSSIIHVPDVFSQLELLDLRFARHSTPLVEYHGHINAYNSRLVRPCSTVFRVRSLKRLQGITTSPCASYVFAAGQDNRIRAWSLQSGEAITPPAYTLPLADSDHSQLLRHTFGDPVTAICVTEGGGGAGADANGLSLWAASGKQIYRYWLGQRLGEGVKGY